MIYATLEDLVERAGTAEIRAISDHNRTGSPDPDVIAAALEDATNTADGYIGARYALPLASVPSLVRTWTVSIARYVLHRNGAPEHVEKDHKDAIAALKDVSRGLIALPVAPGETAPTTESGTVMASHPAEVFTFERLRGWKC